MRSLIIQLILITMLTLLSVILTGLGMYGATLGTSDSGYIVAGWMATFVAGVGVGEIVYG